MGKRWKWQLKLLLLALFSGLCYIVSIYAGAIRGNYQLANMIAFNNESQLRHAGHFSSSYSVSKEKFHSVFSKLAQGASTVEPRNGTESLQVLELPHKLEIARMLEMFNHISAPVIHLKQDKSEPFSASFEKAENTCKKRNLSHLFQDFGSQIDQLITASTHPCYPVDRVLWVTVSNMDNFCQAHIARTLKNIGYNFLNLNYRFTKRKNELPPGSEKLHALIKNYHEWASYSYVIFADTTDVILSKCPTEALKKTLAWMEKQKVDILFNGAPYIWPFNNYNKRWNYKTYNCSYQKSAPDHCFLNSGVWIAKTSKLLLYLEKSLSYSQSQNKKLKRDKLIKNSDQALYIQLHKEFYPKVQIDVNGVLFKRFYLSNEAKYGQYGLGVNQCYLLPDPDISSRCE